MMTINREELFEISETIELMQMQDTIDKAAIQDLELKITDTIENMLDNAHIDWNASRISESIYIRYIPESEDGEAMWDMYEEIRISTHSNRNHYGKNIIVDSVYDMFSKIEDLLQKPEGMYCLI